MKKTDVKMEILETRTFLCVGKYQLLQTRSLMSPGRLSLKDGPWVQLDIEMIGLLWTQNPSERVCKCFCA